MPSRVMVLRLSVNRTWRAILPQLVPEDCMIFGRAKLILLTALVGLLAAGARPASAQNLLVNPGFTGGSTGWTLQSGATFDPTVDIANSATSGSARLATTINTLTNANAIASQ